MRLKKTDSLVKNKILYITASIISLYLISQTIPYVLACYQYDILIKEKISKTQVENILFLYSSRKIPINKSLWGKTTKLKDGEECWQYMILGLEPIDIVYDNQNRVVHIFASFE